jgi:hypothetical protein
MREWPESRLVVEFLARVARVRRLQACALGAAIGLATSAIVVAVLLLNGATTVTAGLTAMVITLVAVAIAWVRVDATDMASAVAVETRTATCRNVLVTATSLLKDAGPTPVTICRVVMHDAAATVQRLNIGELWPWGHHAGRLGAAAVICAAAFLVQVPAVARLLPDLTTEASSSPVVSTVRLAVTPPAYAGGAQESFTDPERLVALAGSRVDVDVAGTGARMSIDTAAGPVETTRTGDGRFVATFIVTTDGFVAVTPFDGDGAAGARRLIGLTATPDQPPVPRVTLPGKDLFLREATATLDLAVEATDDLGLRSLQLAYTKVAGVGESFTFTEGEVPLNITRASGRQWSGTGTLPLASLSLEVGDMVVYRAVAADARPGAKPIESDAFIIEIVSDSEAMAEGFAIDDTKDKYAISQQMVILKTERLIAKAASRPAPSAEAILEEALMISAEQRSVRAELVFMTGGHFEDEFVEAAHEHEIADGRFDNSGRADLGRAIRDMSRAAAELTDGNLKPALEAEKAALEAMQRALSRRRFILRTLTQRESIDDSRRLTGTLSDLARTRRAVAVPTVPPHVAALRDGLAQLGDLAARPALGKADVVAISGVVESLLKAAPGDRAVIDIVSVLSAASEAMTTARERDARTALADAAARITTMLRVAAPIASPGDEADARRLRGALADAQRRGGGR